MLAPDDIGSLLSLLDEDYEFLANLVGIPAKHWDIFGRYLASEVVDVWQHAAGAPAKVKRGAADTAKARRAFVRAIETEGADLPDSVIIKKVREYLQQARKPSLGAPRGERPDRFKAFLQDLLYTIYALDGCAGFTYKTGKGTVVDLLNGLRPFMPPGFIPDWRHPPALLERSCTRARKDEVVEAIADILAPVWPPRCRRRRWVQDWIEAAGRPQNNRFDFSADALCG